MSCLLNQHILLFLDYENEVLDFPDGEHDDMVDSAVYAYHVSSQNKFEFTTIKESLSKTNLSSLKLKDLVNLEKAMTLNSRLDGHIVQGHVDTTGKIKKIVTLKDSWEYYIEFPVKFSCYVIYVGSISVNGVSLTVAQIVSDNSKKTLIKVAIIPHTFEVTNFKDLKVNDTVNIEFDMLGKYVNRIFEKKKKKNK